MANEAQSHSADRLPKSIINITINTTEEECRKIYAVWNKTYEQDSNATGYTIIKPIVKAFDSAMTKYFGEQRKNCKILDAGAGTGLVGEELSAHGYTCFDGLDICQEMLDVAKEKKIYRKLICAKLCEDPISEISAGEYDALISCGTFTMGHARAVALKEIVRHVKSGGVISFTVRADCLENEQLQYQTTINKLIESKKWQLISQDLNDYLVNADRAERYGKCYIFVFQVL